MLFGETKVNAAGQGHLTYSFNDLVLDADRGTLSKSGVEIPLRPKSFDVLVYLIKHQGVLVSKDDLLGAIWPDVVVTEDSLTQCLIEVRKALGDKSKSMIRTVPRRGYLFEVSVQIHEPERRAGEADLNKGLLSRRRPSVWSAVAILLLTIAISFTWWSTTSDSSTLDRVSEARQHYIKGRFFHDRRAEGDISRAIAEFEKAISIDPDLADAWVGLAGSIFARASIYGGGVETVDTDYRTYLLRALDIDPNHAEAHVRMACFRLHPGNPEIVQQHLDLAMKHGQNSPLVMAWTAGMLYDRWRFDEAVELQRRAVELDPLGVVNRANLASMLQSAGLYHESKQEYLVAIALKNDSSTQLLSQLADSYILLHQPAEAKSLMRQLPAGVEKDRIQAMVSLSSGNLVEARHMIEKLEQRDGVEPAFFLAEFYAYRNLNDDAFHWLSIAATRLPNTSNVALTDAWLFNKSHSPYLAGLEKDARWGEWLKSLNYDDQEGQNLVVAQNF